MVRFRSAPRVWGVAAAASLTLVGPACSEVPVDLTSHDVEAIIQETNEQDRIRTAALDDLVITCMTRNGFDYEGPTRNSGEIDLAPGLTGIDRIRAIGSATVAWELWMMDHGEETFTEAVADTPDTVADEAFWEILHETVTIDSDVIPGGCVRWAEDEYLRDHPEHLTRVSLNEAYGEHMSGAWRDDRLAGVHDDWAICMTSNGFDGYHKPGDHMDGLQRRITEIRGSSSDDEEIRGRLEQLKLFDIEVTLSAHTCWAQIEDRRDEILAEYAQLFAETYNDELAQLQNN